MDPERVWNNIIRNLAGRKIELPKVPKVKKIPVWFAASTGDNIVFISEAADHRP